LVYSWSWPKTTRPRVKKPYDNYFEWCSIPKYSRAFTSYAVVFWQCVSLAMYTDAPLNVSVLHHWELAPFGDKWETRMESSMPMQKNFQLGIYLPH